VHLSEQDAMINFRSRRLRKKGFAVAFKDFGIRLRMQRASIRASAVHKGHASLVPKRDPRASFTCTHHADHGQPSFSRRTAGGFARERLGIARISLQFLCGMT